MHQIETVEELVPLLGSPSFIPALHAYLRGSPSGNLPLDPAIFHAILTSIVAGDKNLILHTPEEDVGLVVRLAFWTLSTIFDLPTHRLKIKPPSAPTARSRDSGPPADPSPFLRSLFLQPRNESSDSSRPPSRNRSGKFKRAEHLRSPSSPRLGHAELLVDPNSHRAPASSPHIVTEHDKGIPRQLELPHVLILSGLEDASAIEQRALTTVFMEKKVVIQPPRPEEHGFTQPKFTIGSRSQDVLQSMDAADTYGTWNLPEGFMTIYVCPWDPRERPRIHKSLLDYFAMSSTIVVKQNTRQAFKALQFLSAHHRTRLHSLTHSNPPTPIITTLPLPSYTPPIAPRPLQPPPPAPTVPKQVLPRAFLLLLQSVARNTYFSPGLSLYMADLFSAARHYPQLDGMLLTARAMDDAAALACAWRVLGTDPTGAELLRPQDVYFFDEGDDDEGGYRHQDDDEHNETAGGGISMIVDTPMPCASAENGEGDSRSKHGPPTPPALYVSEADVARVVPRAITHRVRVRDGPADEVLASAVLGATSMPRSVGVGVDSEGEDARSTIKEILVEILAEV